MINFSHKVLDNGLIVLVHEDFSTPMVAVNMLYNVGARDEAPDKTGFAHLFEHLMFSGSEHVPNFDEPIQRAGGDSNAFTNNDMTNFYSIVPHQNIETVLWLESDRMQYQRFDQQSLEIQQKVVVEEFKETCLNQPYGNMWHLLSGMAYKVHPYRWPTIGIQPEHVEDATLDEVRQFYTDFYGPNNAILVIAGHIQKEQAYSLAEKWFGNIPARPTPVRNLPLEPPQNKLEEHIERKNVPVDALYLAFHTAGRADFNFYATDLLSDVLGNGSSSRLYRRLLKEQRLFTQVDAYLSGSIDPGLLIIEGRPAPGVSLKQAEQAIWKELQLLVEEEISEQELQKYKNKVESTIIFSEANVLNKAINLAYFQLLGDPELINREVEDYNQIQVADIHRIAKETFTHENCSSLFYEAG